MTKTLAETITLAQARRRATESLAHTADSAEVDARVLLQFVTGLDHAALLRDPHRALTSAERQRYDSAVTRRRNGEPVAYITGEREFWSLPLRVSRDTLIPRADTEVLVERALARIPTGADWCVADLGTGSGAIALALAHERPQCRIIASDRSEQALAIARDNARRLGLHNIEFRLGSWCDAIEADICRLIISNPPYVPDNDPHLKEGDVRYEPRAALAGGADGLDCIRRIITDAASSLAADSWLLLEHGFDQGAAVRELLTQAKYEGIASHRDLADHERVTEASYRPND